jgi:alkanesulfonate monooxygenase SsuD/methylene tetrahydromethanopterin reductase-like flavin-dependent oxidoreductase (luciferase family)
MRFGVGLWCLQSTAHSPRSHVRAYRELREDAALVESLGFEGIWLSEHHFFYDGYCPALLPAAASALALTRRLRVGTGMLLLPLQDPGRVATCAADLARRSGGRLDLGVGLGYREAEFAGKDVPIRERLPRLVRGLEVLETAGASIWMGGAAARTAARAGERGHPLLLSGALPAAKVRDLGRAHRSAWEAAGRPGPAPVLGALRNIWVTDDRAEREAVLDWVRASYVLYAGLGWAVPAEGEHAEMDFLRDTRAAIADAVATTIIGPAGHVVEALQELADAGVGYVACRLMLEGAPRQAIHAVLHRLADGVLPALS